MLRRVDRILLRVPSLPAAVKYYREVLGLRLIKEDRRLAAFQLTDSDTELVLHCDEDLPADATYFLVDDVRKLYERRLDLKIQFVNPPAPGARGYRAAIKDPFGNVVLIVDHTAAQASQAIEDAKAPGTLFAGVEDTKVPVKVDALIQTYAQIGRTADDLPYTPDFEKLHLIYCAQHPEKKPTRQETWRHLLNLRKSKKLPKLGAARSVPPELTEQERQQLRELLGESIGRRDRLPYSDTFDKLVDQFNQGRRRAISPHLVWRAAATLAK